MVQTQAWKQKHKVEINPDILRHMILKSLLYFSSMFKKSHGECVIACDSPPSWRKFAFENYKAKRSDVRKSFDIIDWPLFYKLLDEVIQEIDEHFPYHTVQIKGAEGDDVIGAIVRHVQNQRMMEDIMIVSGDKDFKQLHNSRTRQYSPALKKFIGSTDPRVDLIEHICRGDRIDGIPNILSNDNALLVGDRQGKITAKRLDFWINNDPESYPPSELRNFRRNEKLIDLSKMPTKLSAAIIDRYEECRAAPLRNNVFNYLYEKQLKELMLSAGEF